ncbi:hypothetical protein PAPYR_2938 [Paratrimastix pyriformis]|uniref:UBC core domain-containing protein n=1 Tax=Paratrimastix pyriformis TaxID=342808 RepID=A0ABQ8UVD0_9EUKA|nr:hypothetical protein PAPYR_2938 [Paratrimastix pyriformis]
MVFFFFFPFVFLLLVSPPRLLRPPSPSVNQKYSTDSILRYNGGRLLKRVEKELVSFVGFANDDPNLVALWQIETGHFQVVIRGKAGGCYDGLFLVDIQHNKDFPFRPPIVQFRTPSYHPGINPTGQFCAPTLRDNWSPAYTLLHVCQVALDELDMELDSFRECGTLRYDLLQQLLSDRAAFECAARAWTLKHATPTTFLQMAEPPGTSSDAAAPAQAASPPEEELGGGGGLLWAQVPPELQRLVVLWGTEDPAWGMAVSWRALFGLVRVCHQWAGWIREGPVGLLDFGGCPCDPTYGGISRLSDEWVRWVLGFCPRPRGVSFARPVAISRAVFSRPAADLPAGWSERPILSAEALRRVVEWSGGSLETVDLTDWAACRTADLVRLLQGCRSSLRSLSFTAWAPGCDAAEALGHLVRQPAENLREVNVWGQLTDEAWSALRKLPRLERLGLQWPRDGAAGHLTDPAMMPALRTVTMASEGRTEAEWAAFVAAMGIRGVDVAREAQRHGWA